LRRIFAVSQHQLFPFIAMLPTRTNPHGATVTDSPIGATLLQNVEKR